MRRRRRSKRYIDSRFARGAAITVLTLWVGLLLVGILNYDRPEAKVRTEAAAFESRIQRQSNKRAQNKLLARSKDNPTTPPSNRESAVAQSQRESEVPDSSEEPESVSDMARLKAASEDVVDIPSADVARAQFTTGIEAREPVDRVTSVFSTNGEVFSLDGWPLPALYYFTEITDGSGETVIHRWEYNGRVMAKTSFDIGGDHWRVYSHKELPSDMPGRWRVVVTDARGNVLKTNTLLYQAD